MTRNEQIEDDVGKAKISMRKDEVFIRWRGTEELSEQFRRATPGADGLDAMCISCTGFTLRYVGVCCGRQKAQEH